jgi:uncharacterized membrane protein
MSAESQWFINLLIGLCGAFGAYVLRSVSSEQKEIQEAHARLAARMDNLPNLYARRDDLKDAVERIEDGLHRIEAKLDAKADK